MSSWNIGLAALLLASCAPNVKQTRTVKVFEHAVVSDFNSFEYTRETIVHTAKVSVFNQRNQTISIIYASPKDTKIDFSVRNGTDIYISSGGEETQLLKVWKTAPHEDRAFVLALIPDNEDAQNGCKIVHDDDGIWTIISKPLHLELSGSWVLYPPLPARTIGPLCGPLTYTRQTPWRMGIKDGIAIAYDSHLSDVGFFDLYSVTYESTH